MMRWMIVVTGLLLATAAFAAPPGFAGKGGREPIDITADRLEALSAAILQHHPYELPEILALSPNAGLPAYLDWIRAQTREDT